MAASTALSPDAQCALAAALLAERLDGVVGHWRAEGAHVIGPGNTGIGLVEHAGTEPGHVDVGFVLDRKRPGAPILWDCAAGAGEDVPTRIRAAVDGWMTGTWPVVHELLSGRGTYAARCPGDHPLGLPGWHVLRGPLLAFGDRGAAETLQAWALTAPLLATIAEPLTRSFDRPALNGVRLTLGPQVAEVRVNGRLEPGASEALAEHALPALPAFAFVRAFSLAVSPDRPGGTG